VGVDLRDGAPVAGKPFPAPSVCLEDCFVHLRLVPFHPAKEGRPEIETDLRVVVDDVDNPSLPVQDPGCGIGGVTFRRDSLVPVVIGIGGILELHILQPRVLTRGLVEVTVDANILNHENSLPLVFLNKTSPNGFKVIA